MHRSAIIHTFVITIASFTAEPLKTMTNKGSFLKTVYTFTRGYTGIRATHIGLHINMEFGSVTELQVPKSMSHPNIGH